MTEKNVRYILSEKVPKTDSGRLSYMHKNVFHDNSPSPVPAISFHRQAKAKLEKIVPQGSIVEAWDFWGLVWGLDFF